MATDHATPTDSTAPDADAGEEPAGTLAADHPLVRVAVAREELEAIDRDDVDMLTEKRLRNTLETLDNIILDRPATLRRLLVAESESEPEGDQ